MHLHRLAAAASTRRGGGLSVLSACRGDHLRDDCLLHPVAHADADHGRLAATRSGGGAADPAPKHPGFFTRFQAGFEARFERFRERYRAIAGGACRARQSFIRLVSFRGAGVASAVALRRSGFLPEHQIGRDRSAHARADRHADRGVRQDLACWWTSRSATFCPATWWAR